MPVFPWFVAIAASGSIGLLAMTARVLSLEEKRRLDAALIRKKCSIILALALRSIFQMDGGDATVQTFARSAFGAASVYASSLLRTSIQGDHK